MSNRSPPHPARRTDVGDVLRTRLAAAGIEVSGPRAGIKPGTLVATLKGERAHGVATLLIEHTAESFRPESRLPQGEAFDNAPGRAAFAATGLDHVVVSAIDLEATIAKWTGTLGLRAGLPGQPAGANFRVATLAAGNAFVELVQPLMADHRIAATIAERGQGMYSISVRVDSLDAAVADLPWLGGDALPFRCAQRRPRAGTTHRLSCTPCGIVPSQ